MEAAAAANSNRNLRIRFMNSVGDICLAAITATFCFPFTYFALRVLRDDDQIQGYLFSAFALGGYLFAAFELGLAVYYIKSHVKQFGFSFTMPRNKANQGPNWNQDTMGVTAAAADNNRNLRIRFRNSVADICVAVFVATVCFPFTYFVLRGADQIQGYLFSAYALGLAVHHIKSHVKQFGFSYTMPGKKTNQRQTN